MQQDKNKQKTISLKLGFIYYQTCSKAEEWDNKRFSTQEVSGLSSQHWNRLLAQSIGDKENDITTLTPSLNITKLFALSSLNI